MPATPPPAVLPPPGAARRRPGRRDWLLRLTLLAVVLGAVLTVVEGALPVTAGPYATVLGVPAAAYYQVLIPLLALVAVAGALILDRQPLLGLLLLLGGTLLALRGGGMYLAPAALLGAAWAVWRHRAARAALGLVLLIPGVVAGYYGLAAAITRLSGAPLPGLPAALSPPGRWGQLALPLAMLLVGWLGAVLLLSRHEPDA
ncbi:MAG: hypothetical protein ACRD2E_11980 [Terriglobales bacterium]